MFTNDDFTGAQAASYFLLFVASPTWKILFLGLCCGKGNVSDSLKGAEESAWMI